MAKVYPRDSLSDPHVSDLQAAFDQLKIAVDLMPMGVSYADLRSGRILYGNQRFHDLIGGDPGPMTVPAWLERFVSGDANIRRLKQMWSPERAAGLDVPVEVTPADIMLRCLDGTMKPVAMTGIMIPATGQMLATFIDLSERVATQRALANSQLRLFSALSASRRGLYEVELRTHTLTMVVELNSIPNLLTDTNSIPLRRFWTRLHPEDRQAAVTVYRGHVAGTIDEYRLEYRVRLTTGDWLWVESAGAVIERDDAGMPVRVIGTYCDINDRKLAERQLETSNAELTRSLRQLQRYELEGRLLRVFGQSLLAASKSEDVYAAVNEVSAELFAAYPGYIAVIQESGTLAMLNRWGGITCSGASTLADCQALARGVPLQAASCPSCLLDGAGETLCVPVRMQQSKGIWHLTGLPSPEDSDRASALITTMHHMIEMALSSIKLREGLQEQALHDPLTGLYNRRYLNETINRDLADVERTGQPLAVALLDLDHFKHFNDTYGHAVGDLVLSRVAQVLQASCRQSDMVCRFGGEEFMLVMPGTTQADALAKLDDLRRRIGSIHETVNELVIDFPTISAGLAMAPLNGRTLEQLAHCADAALYEAKHRGRDRALAYEPAMEAALTS
ncbi:diguanylate cyclase [Parapedomonas caeni]